MASVERHRSFATINHLEVLAQTKPLHSYRQNQKGSVGRSARRSLAVAPSMRNSHARNAITSGDFPLWSSAMGAGHPFFAAVQTSVLSPFTIADYVLPFPWSFAVDTGLRLLAGGLGMYALLRSWQLSAPAAAFCVTDTMRLIESSRV